MLRSVGSLSIVLVLFAMTLHAQNSERRNAVSLKYIFLDYKGPNDGGDMGDFSNYTSGVEVSYSRNIHPNVNLTVPFRVASVEFQDSVEGDVTTDIGITGQYLFKPEGSFVSPYVMAGANAVYEFQTESFGLVIPAGIGADFWFSKNVALNIQMEYRYGLEDNRNNLHHGIGFKYFPGRTKDKDEENIINDFDGDGVPDEKDLCPDAPGSIETNGCPDTDGDGLVDFEDECPNAAGAISLGGCPDRDNDGIIDKEDNCPDLPGSAENKGCPNTDQDGDGVPDEADECPSTPGPVATKGCPDSDGDGVIDLEDACPNAPGTSSMSGCPDTDGDRVHDGLDNCPNTFGSVDNNGCPEVTREIREILEFARSAVQFETAQSSLKSESFIVLDQIVQIMRDNPSFNLNISGHTDSDGDALKNLDLSERRAKACYDYLASRGVSKSRLGYVGYGESRPIASNANAAGKLKNRRVEFEVKFN